MKTLFVLRHAKSSWDNANLSDFDRPLNERGERDAPRIGKLMSEKGFVPDLILSSPARRARETAQLVKEAARLTAPVRFEPRIYEAGTTDLLQVVGAAENDCERLLLIGHNPGLENLVRALTGKIESFPTAALAEISLDIASWNAISPGSGELKNLFKPKEIAGF